MLKNTIHSIINKSISRICNSDIRVKYREYIRARDEARWRYHDDMRKVKEEGRAEGIAEAKTEFIRQMRSAGLSEEEIKRIMNK